MKNDKMVRFLKNIMVLIAVLPLLGSCIREDEVANSPQGNFETLWKIIDEQYCFLEYKQIDWDAIHDEYSRLITGSMSSEGLFEVLGNMLNELQDGHVNLASSHNVSYYDAWYQDYPRNFREDIVEDFYLGKASTDYRTAAGIKYKIFEDNIGYMRYESFSSGIGNGNLDEILSYLAPCSGLIIDVRNNGGGNIVATIVNPEHRPQMATVREGVMKKEILDADYKGEVIRHDVAKYVPETDYVVKVIDRHVEKAKHNLKGAPIVIAGGYGMGSRENFDMLFDLAKELHAEVGASRAAVDAGYADHDRQIGQTGVTVRPKLYIACGISGQIQHIAGMQESGIIISVNNDENAPINAIADYVINGTVEEVIPKMIKYYKQNSK